MPRLHPRGVASINSKKRGLNVFNHRGLNSCLGRFNLLEKDNMLDKLKARLEQLTTALEQSAAHHNALAGALQEVKKLYEDALAAEPLVVEVAQDVIAVAENLS